MIPPGLRHRVAEHAASGALRDLLEHYRLSYSPEPLSEGAIFGFSGALDLRVRIADAAVPTIDLDGRAPSLEPELCEHLGIAARWHTTSDPMTGWELLQRRARHRPPGARARRPRRAGLPPAATATTRATRSSSRAGTPTAGVVWVADGSFPEPQRCSLRALAAARASQGWPEPAHHGLLAVRARPERLADPHATVAAALRRVIAAMRHPARPDHPHVSAGLAAADALAAAWPRLPDAAGPRLGATLAALRFRIRDGGTGGALYRSLQARFLHEAAALLGSPALGHAALVCDDLADAWRALADSIEGDDPAFAHRVGAPWVQRICALEHAHVEALEEHLRIHRAIAA